MSNMACSCGEFLNNREIPNDVEWTIFSKNDFNNSKNSEYFEYIDDQEDFDYLWLCPKCKRLHVWLNKGRQHEESRIYELRKCEENISINQLEEIYAFSSRDTQNFEDGVLIKDLMTLYPHNHRYFITNDEKIVYLYNTISNKIDYKYILTFCSTNQYELIFQNDEYKLIKTFDGEEYHFDENGNIINKIDKKEDVLNMLIDPDSYIDLKTNWNLEQLYKEKQKLEKYISDYKNGKLQSINEGYITNPSPEIISNMYKEYLIKLNDLIAEKEREKKEERKYIELTDYNEIIDFLQKNDFLDGAEICGISKKDGNAGIFFEYGNQEVEFYLSEVIDFTLDYYTYENYIDSISIKNNNGLINLEIDDNVISISAKSIKLKALDIENTIYTYVSVKYSKDQEKTFYYISNIDNLKIGDYVWVSARYIYCPAIVERIEKFSYSNVPFPISRTKRIIRKSSKEEFDEFKNKGKNAFDEDYDDYDDYEDDDDFEFEERETIKERAKKLPYIKSQKVIECPCCGSKEVPKGELGLGYICNRCGWEKDGIQEDKPNYKGGANKMSLNEARKAFKEGRKVE